MASFRVLVVVNLWPYPDDPSYGCFVQAQMESLRALGVEYDVVFINGRISRWNYARAILELRRRVRATRYDLIHAHMGLSGWVARCQWGVPVIVSFLGNDVPGKVDRRGRTTRYGRLLECSSYVLARQVSAVIVKTTEMKRRLKLDSAYVIPNGVDLNLFRPMTRDEARQILGLDRRKKFVLFPYNPAEERKRFDLVEAAARRAREHVPELGILPVMRVPQARMPLYMNAADVLVMASMMEGSPNAVKEAMATNLPVVAVDVGDTVELLAGTEGNYIVPRNAAALATKIAEVCLRGARAQGRDAIARLSIENVACRILEVYARVARPKSDREGVNSQAAS